MLPIFHSMCRLVTHRNVERIQWVVVVVLALYTYICYAYPESFWQHKRKLFSPCKSELLDCPLTNVDKNVRQLCFGDTLTEVFTCPSYAPYLCGRDTSNGWFVELCRNETTCHPGTRPGTTVNSKMREYTISCVTCSEDTYEDTETSTLMFSAEGCKKRRRINELNQDGILEIDRGSVTRMANFTCDSANGYYNGDRRMYCDNNHPCFCVKAGRDHCSDPQLPEFLPDGSCDQRCHGERNILNNFECLPHSQIQTDLSIKSPTASSEQNEPWLLKLGIGLGVTIGMVSIVAAIAFYCWLQRRRGKGRSNHVDYRTVSSNDSSQSDGQRNEAQGNHVHLPHTDQQQVGAHNGFEQNRVPLLEGPHNDSPSRKFQQSALSLENDQKIGAQQNVGQSFCEQQHVDQANNAKENTGHHNGAPPNIDEQNIEPPNICQQNDTLSNVVKPEYVPLDIVQQRNVPRRVGRTSDMPLNVGHSTFDQTQALQPNGGRLNGNQNGGHPDRIAPSMGLLDTSGRPNYDPLNGGQPNRDCPNRWQPYAGHPNDGRPNDGQFNVGQTHGPQQPNDGLSHAEQRNGDQQNGGRPHDSPPNGGEPNRDQANYGRPNDGPPKGGEPNRDQANCGQPNDGPPNGGETNRDQVNCGQPNDGPPNNGEPNRDQANCGQPNDGPPNGGEPNRDQANYGQPNDGPPNRDQANCGQPNDGPPNAGQPDYGLRNLTINQLIHVSGENNTIHQNVINIHRSGDGYGPGNCPRGDGPGRGPANDAECGPGNGAEGGHGDEDRWGPGDGARDGPGDGARGGPGHYAGDGPGPGAGGGGVDGEQSGDEEADRNVAPFGIAVDQDPHNADRRRAIPAQGLPRETAHDANNACPEIAVPLQQPEDAGRR